ncbi:hypothetical protein D3C76_1794660 [compost metagenome]
MVGRQRLFTVDIQHRPFQLATLQRRQQIGLHHVNAARQVHQIAVIRQLIQQTAIDDPDRLRRIWQEVNQHPRAL